MGDITLWAGVLKRSDKFSTSAVQRDAMSILKVSSANDIILFLGYLLVSELASFCQSRKNQWQKPVITGTAKTLWQKWQKLAKTT